MNRIRTEHKSNMNIFKNKRAMLEQIFSIINKPKSISNNFKNKRTKSNIRSTYSNSINLQSIKGNVKKIALRYCLQAGRTDGLP